MKNSLDIVAKNGDWLKPSKAVMQHLSEKCDFRVPVFCQVQKQ